MKKWALLFVALIGCVAVGAVEVIPSPPLIVYSPDGAITTTPIPMLGGYAVQFEAAVEVDHRAGNPGATWEFIAKPVGGGAASWQQLQVIETGPGSFEFYISGPYYGLKGVHDYRVHATNKSGNPPRRTTASGQFTL